MDKRETIRQFVRRNSKIFRQTEFPWEVYKKLKHSFFIDQLKAPTPRDSEIANYILEGMIVSLQVKTKDELEKILILPFFKAKIVNKQYFREKLETKLRQETPFIDVESIKKAEISEKIRNEIKAEAKREIIEEKDLEVQELEKKITEKAEEYESVRSVLDLKAYPVPDIEEVVKPANQIYVPWWEKLGLREDPFRELEGLSRFDRTLYNRIVYKTNIFIKYESMARSSLSELFRNTVVYGHWGSGKTTFFNYMCSILDDYKVRPIYIRLIGEFEVRELIFDFTKNFSVELRKLYNIFAGENASPIEITDDEQINIELMKRLAYLGAKGFVVFIDDLHKGEDLKKAMRFLSSLQIIAARYRIATNLNIGFFIAGSTDWETEIKNDDKYISSISRQEHMPPLEIDVALEAINKRLKAFAKNPENPRQIERPLIEKIYKSLKSNPEEITFRRIMYELLNEFESDHFDALTANPIIIPKSTLQGINLLLECQPKTKKILNNLMHSMLKPYQKRRCLELLISIYLSDGIPDSGIAEEDKPFMQQLKNANLITKIMEKELTWKISRDLFFTNQKIIHEYGLSLEDYLLKLYSAELPNIEKNKVVRHREITKLDSLLFYLKNGPEKSYLEQAKLLHLKILDYRTKYMNSEELLDKNIDEICCEALAQLTMAYMTYEKIRIPRRTNLEKILFWESFWYSPEVVLQFGRAYTANMEDNRKIPLVLSLYREAFPLLVDFFINEYEKSQSFYIHLSYLKNDEIKLMHECRQLWNDKEFIEVAGVLSTAIERKIKLFLYNIFSVIYGAHENRLKLLDYNSREIVGSYVQKDTVSGFSSSINEFQRLNRNNFANLMTGIEGSIAGRKNWKNVFSSVFIKWSEITLYDYLKTINNIKVQLEKAQDIESKSRLIYDFMLMSTTFIRSLNRVYINIITRADYLKNNSETLAFNLGSSDDPLASPISLNENDMEKIENAFIGKNRIKVNFEDQEFIQGYFGLDYRKVYAALALFYKGLTVNNKKSDFKINVLASKGPEIRLACYRSPELKLPFSEKENKKIEILSVPENNSPANPQEIQEVEKYLYDVFICHASEDKEPFVRELAVDLSKSLRVWYDEFSLSLGDSLRQKIDEGIKSSRYGIVVLSENFFEKDWPQKELDALVTKERNSVKVILPIWHGVNRERVETFSPILAGKLAASSRKGIDYVVQEVLRAVKP